MLTSSTLSFAERKMNASSPVAKKLFQIITEKQTNLALSADVTSAAQLICLADQLGPEICILKTHIDILTDFSPKLTQTLRQLADKHHFLIFEDRKFADIGNTVKHQFQHGVYQIASWADMINAHSLPGPSIIEGLMAGMGTRDCGIILIAEMSSKDHLMTEEYRQKTLEMAEKYSDHVFGFITQRAISDNPKWLNLTPGVKINEDSDSLGQLYISPKRAILQQASDIIIVGRGIIAQKDPLTMAKKYRQTAWQAYQERS